MEDINTDNIDTENNSYNENNSDIEMNDMPINSVNVNSYPLCFHNTLLESEIDRRERSDGIYLSNDRFRYFNNTDSDELVIIKITKGNRSTYANIIGVHSEGRNMVFMPMWMCTYLNADCGDNVTVSRYSDYRIGMNIRIQPHTSAYATLEDPAAALRDAFESYTILQSGMDIPLHVAGELLVVSIVDTHNVGPICIRGVELAVEIDRPLDMPPEEEKHVNKRPRIDEASSNPIVESFNDADFDSFLPLISETPKTDNRFPGKGNVLGR
jgi:hypothetical protein